MATLFGLALHGAGERYQLGLLNLERARAATALPTNRWVDALEEDAVSFMNYWNRLAPQRGQDATGA
jgi:hypothetical protein